MKYKLNRTNMQLYNGWIGFNSAVGEEKISFLEYLIMEMLSAKDE